MRKIFGFLGVVVMIFAACAAQKKAPTANNVTYVQMWRTACFGKCPNYKIEVFGEGLVRYTGYSFTQEGVYEKNIGAAAAKRILDGYAAKNVDTLQDQYNMRIADLPGIQYIFQYGKTVKKVYNAEFGPEFLRDMANDLDKLVNKEVGGIPSIDNSWKKISDSPKGD
jgi:hypothetical protein